MSTPNDTPNERWLPVVEYEEFYLVSDLGRIMRIGAVSGARVGRILKPRKVTHGYVAVHLCKNGTIKGSRVHQIVLRAFVGEYPDGMSQINHINGDKADNRLVNLEYCTPSQNSRHAIDTGLATFKRGEDSRLAKLTQAQVDEIRAMLAEKKYKLKEIGDKYGVSYKTIGNIKYNHRWKI